MKMLCSGSDLDRLEQTRKRLLSAGISCELRRDIPGTDIQDVPSYPELWIKAEADFSHAVSILSHVCRPSPLGPRAFAP